MPTFEVDVNPKLLDYAIKSSGYEVGELAEKINAKKMDKDRLVDLASGKKKPLITEIEKIDGVLKRGLPFFFLSEVPDEEKILRYRRKIPGLHLDPSTEVTLRDFNFLREEIKYMLDETGTDFGRKDRIYTLKASAEKTAGEFRKLFGYSPGDFESLGPRDVFDHLRNRIEERNVFVFKNIATSEKLDDNLRGCVFLKSDLPPLILINSTDDKNAEIFTLLHEFAHYLLNEEELDTESVSDDYNSPAEKWCNDFAYSFLISPHDEAKENFAMENHDHLTKPETLRSLSGKYKISRAALMYRFLIKEIISLETYLDFREKNRYKVRRSGSGGGNYHATLRSKMSGRYVSLVDRSYRNNSISLNDALRYVKAKDSGKFKEMAEAVIR